MTPNRVNRAHWPTKGNRQHLCIFSFFSAHAKNCLKWHEMGPGAVFSTNPDLANILGETDVDFENLYFSDFLDPIFLDYQIPAHPDSKLSSSYICPGW